MGRRKQSSRSGRELEAEQQIRGEHGNRAGREAKEQQLETERRAGSGAESRAAGQAGSAGQHEARPLGVAMNVSTWGARLSLLRGVNTHGDVAGGGTRGGRG